MYVGWDISTAIVGLAIFDSSGHFVSARYCDLREIVGLNLKADKLLEFVNDVLSDPLLDLDLPVIHCVEDRLSGFNGGGSNMGTLMMLSAFNAMACWMIWRAWTNDNGVPTNIMMLHPSTVKSVLRADGLVIPKGGDKKKITLGFVRAKEHSFPVVLNRNGNPQPYCYDMGDAYVTARAGYLISCRGKEK